MNILRIVYDWPEPWYGLAPGPYFLSRSQGLLGHKITVFTGGLDIKRRLLKGKIKEKPEKNVVVYHLPRALTRHIGPFLTTSPVALLGYLWKRFILRNVDVLHGHGHTMLWFNFYKLIFSIFDRVPYVVHFHICSRERAKLAKEKGEKFKFMQRFFENPLHDLSDRLGIKVADACIFPSETTMEQFKKYYTHDKTKLFVVENGIPTHIFYPDEKDQLSLSKEILYVGVLSPRKGFDLLIESLKYLPSHFTLRWIGNIQEEKYKEELVDLAKNLNVEHRVVFHGYVSNLEISPFYRTASIFALASQSEGLPKVVIEALACGTPVIASGFKAKDEIEGLNYFSSLTPKVIAREIKEIIDSGQVVDVKKVKNIFSWDNKAKEIEKVYNFVLKDKI